MPRKTQDIFASVIDVAKAFPGGQVTHPEDQDRKKIKKNRVKLKENTGKGGKI